MKTNSKAPAAVLDSEGALARLGGDRALFLDITNFFLEDAPPLFSRVRKAIQGGEADAVRASVHALKGLLLNCGGVRAAQSAQALEDAASADDLSNADGLAKTLETELGLLTEAIHAYQREQ